MPLSGLDQVPIYHNVYNGELFILSTPIDIRTVSYHIQGKISSSMICSLSINQFLEGVQKKKILLINFMKNVIYPSYDIGDLKEVLNFLGYYNTCSQRIVLNNQLRKEVGIDEISQQLVSTSIDGRFKVFRDSIGNCLNEDILTLIREKIIPTSLSDLIK